MTPQKFRNIVWKYWKEQGRHDLPWRKTTDPYKILVSEVMLQQTQVERVIPHYRSFLERFPTVRALAEAPLSEVLISWQGLGYNRRAKMLHEAAKCILTQQPVSTAQKNTRLNLVFPENASELEKLPGIGPYTAGAVVAFAYNHDGIFVETNIRTVITHHFFSTQQLGKTVSQNTIIYDSILDLVDDRDIRKVLEKVYPQGRAREWYAALMDYGAHLKRSGVRINAKAKDYKKQSAFRGSGREVRGAIVRALSGTSQTESALTKLFPKERASQMEEQIEKLAKEGIIVKKGATYSLAS